jgi:hypothetical protein
VGKIILKVLILMASVYFKGVNVGTLQNSAVKRLKDKKVRLDVRNGAVILNSVED